MLKQNGMIMLSEEEFKRIVEKEEAKVRELEEKNELLRKAIMQLTAKDGGCKDVRVSMDDFLKMYDAALNYMFDNPDKESNDIYGYDITVHWHGVYCNCSDGATPTEYIIPAIKDCLESDGEYF